jgi:hypothetical protein
VGAWRTYMPRRFFSNNYFCPSHCFGHPQSRALALFGRHKQFRKLWAWRSKEAGAPQPTPITVNYPCAHIYFNIFQYRTRTEPVCVNLLRSPGIDSQPVGIDSSESIPGILHIEWRRSSRVVRASDCQCQRRNSPGFDPIPSILRPSGTSGAAGEAVLNKV